MPLLMPAETSEFALITRVRSGDPASLGALFDTHGPDIYRIAYRLVGTREDAEDTVQDVFCALPRALSRYDHEGSFGAWIRRVTVRTALMRLRAARRRPVHAVELAASKASASRDVALQVTLDDALRQLPDGLRDVAVLRLVADYTHEEIAATLGIGVSASKVRLHRAIQRLQHLLKGSL